MSGYICPYTCSYRTNSGYCGLTGGAENCQTRKFLGYNSETRQFIVEPVAAGNIVVQSLQTNADRIRAMSDEELARFIADQRGWFCDFKDPTDEEYPKVLDWLKQEADE